MKTITIPPAPDSLHNNPSVLQFGADIDAAKTVVIMVHGRGATAESILDLARYLPLNGVSYIAPQATGQLWYPYSFLVPLEQNEPWLSAALQRLTEIVDFTVASGVPEKRVFLFGFSQGASLSLEWTARSGRPIGGVFGLSGGLIGPPGLKRNYQGELPGTTVFIGCSDVDFHIPKDRVVESAEIFKAMKANVTMRLYPDMDHTVNEDEIAFVSTHITSAAGI